MCGLVKPTTHLGIVTSKLKYWDEKTGPKQITSECLIHYKSNANYSEIKPRNCQ